MILSVQSSGGQFELCVPDKRVPGFGFHDEEKRLRPLHERQHVQLLWTTGLVQLENGQYRNEGRRNR